MQKDTIERKWENEIASDNIYIYRGKYTLRNWELECGHHHQGNKERHRISTHNVPLDAFSDGRIWVSGGRGRGRDVVRWNTSSRACENDGFCFLPVLPRHSLHNACGLNWTRLLYMCDQYVCMYINVFLVFFYSNGQWYAGRIDISISVPHPAVSSPQTKSGAAAHCLRVGTSTRHTRTHQPANALSSSPPPIFTRFTLLIYRDKTQSE